MLPKRRHLPGTGSTPDMAPLELVKRRCAASVRDHHWKDNAAYRYGWYLFVNEYYWESHEVWEKVWLTAPVNSRTRFLLQCLIQLANARLKLLLGRPRAASRLFDQCAELALSAFPPNGSARAGRLLGISYQVLIAQIKNDL